MGNADNLYHRYLNGNDEEREKLIAEEPEIVEFLDKASQLKNFDFPRAKEEIWEEIEKDISVDEADSAHQGRSFSWLAVAATVALLIVAGFAVFTVLSPDELTINTGMAENKTVALPDGSKAILNAASSLAYTEGNGRSLTLQGEAFFEVVKGEDFNVHTKMGKVSVLGTSFNVSSRENVFVVSCKTGKVKVSFAGNQHKSVILTKGQFVSLDGGQLIIGHSEAGKIASWQSGEFYYDSRPLREVFADISRQYDKQIRFADSSIPSRLFKGYFFKEKLETSLSLICDPMGLSYEINGDTVTIDMKD